MTVSVVAGVVAVPVTPPYVGQNQFTLHPPVVVAERTKVPALFANVGVGMFRLGGVNIGLAPVYGNVKPLFASSIEVKVANRFVDHAAFVNWYVSVVGLVVVLPVEKVVPVGSVTFHAIPPAPAVPVWVRVIENLRSAPTSAVVGAETARLGVATESSPDVTDRPVSCVTNFTLRVYVVAFSAGKLDVIWFDATVVGEFISVSVFPLIRYQKPTVAADAVTLICLSPVFVNVGPVVIVAEVVTNVVVVGVAPQNPLYLVFSEIG